MLLASQIQDIDMYRRHINCFGGENKKSEIWIAAENFGMSDLQLDNETFQAPVFCSSVFLGRGK